MGGQGPPISLACLRPGPLRPRAPGPPNPDPGPPGPPSAGGYRAAPAKHTKQRLKAEGLCARPPRGDAKRSQQSTLNNA